MKKIFLIIVLALLPLISSAQEQIIQGAFLNNGNVSLCLLMYNNGKITHYAVSKTITGQYDWQTMYPDNPHPTNSVQDASMFRSYNYKVTIGKTVVYFNLKTENPGYGNSYGNNNGYGTSNGFNNNSGVYGNTESVIQGVFVYNGQQTLINLRYVGGKITHYALSKDALGRLNWQTMYPDNPHPTNHLQDGNMSRAYKYKITIESTTVYFNLR